MSVNELQDVKAQLTQDLLAAQQSEQLLTKERDRLQKEVESLRADAGDGGTAASYGRNVHGI